MMNDYELYDRQDEMSIYVPDPVLIVGVGGVGSWVALNFALVGCRTVYVVDPDIIEVSNLNRTPFTVSHVGLAKVDAVAELITDRRPQCNVIPFREAIENLSPEILGVFKDSYVFDCRDNIAPFDNGGALDGGICCGYDGSSVTIHTNPSYESVFGSDEPIRYRIVPSFVGAPAFLASVILCHFCLARRGGKEAKRERVITLDLKNIVKILELGAIAYGETEAE